MAGLVLGSLVVGAAAAGPIKVAVLDLQATGVEAEVARNVSDFFVTRISDLGCCVAISSSDIQAMLGFEKQKQLLQCADEGSCIAEIGGALGVDKLATGSVGRLGKAYLLTLKLIDVRSARVEARFSERVSGEVEALLDLLESGVERIFEPVRGKAAAGPSPAVAVAPPPDPAPTPAPAARPAPPQAKASPPEPPPPSIVSPEATRAEPGPTAPPGPFPWGWVLVGAGAAAAAGAAGSAVAGNASFAEYQRLLTAEGTERDALVDQANLLTGAAVALGVAALVSAAGGVLILAR